MRHLIALLIVSLLALPAAAQTAAPQVAAVRGTTYAIAREALIDAIEAQGLVAGTISHFGEMLARTGKDLGHDKPVYGDAEIVQFCSAAAAWQLTIEDPRMIVNCPLSVALYTLAGDTATVYYAYRSPGRATPALQRADDLLKTVVEAAVEQARR